MKIVLICFISIVGVVTANSQGLNFDRQDYCGYDSIGYYFFQFGSRSGHKPGIIRYSLNGHSAFEKPEFVPWDQNKGALLWIRDSVEVFNGGASKLLTILINDKEYKYETEGMNNFSIALFPDSDTLLISAHSESPIYLFNLKTREFTTLPLVGGNLTSAGDFVFFEAPRYSDDYSSFPTDVFKLKKNDLKNPERLLIQVAQLWHPFSEDVVYAVTDPRINVCGDEKCEGAFYDISARKFSSAPIIPTDRIIEVKGKNYILNLAETSDGKNFELLDVPEIPQTFPYEFVAGDNQISRGNIFKYYNLPLGEKITTGTFINHHLLFEASKAELSKLSKSQLRILLNTFYAFQGYKFSSEDLRDYFNQFGWYQKLTLGDRKNEEVIIWPDEIERVELIRAVSDQK